MNKTNQTEKVEALKLIEKLDEIAIEYFQDESEFSHGLPTSDETAVKRMCEVAQEFLSARPSERAELEKAVEALEHYANESNWSVISSPPIKQFYTPFERNGFEVARQALEGGSDEKT